MALCHTPSIESFTPQPNRRYANMDNAPTKDWIVVIRKVRDTTGAGNAQRCPSRHRQS